MTTTTEAQLPVFEIRLSATGAIRETVNDRATALRRQDWFIAQDRVAHHIVVAKTVTAGA